MGAHRIRLRAPWRRETLAKGGLRWTRRFHRPTGLSSADRVWVVVAGKPAGGEAWLNGRSLGVLTVGGETRFDVTLLLAEFSELAIGMGEQAEGVGAGDAPAEVWLEIG